MKYLRILAVPVALACIGFGLWRLENATVGLTVTHSFAGRTPVTVFRPRGGAPAPVVVIAHGFAGSQQLMQPFAATLARNGFIAVTYDCLGHGRNPQPMRGDVTKVDTGPTPLLLAEFGRVAAYAQRLPGADGRIAVLGHSMMTDIVIRYAQAHPEVAATVAVSMYSPVVTATSPKDLNVIVGDMELPLKHEARRVVRMVSGSEPEPRVTYGNIADGTARRLSFSPNVEHIGVLYSPQSMAEARDWLVKVFGLSGNGYLDERGSSIVLLFLGLVLLGWPLASLLPRVSVPPTGAGLPWRKVLPVALVPALLTPLILSYMPTHFMPILLGDYITVHFGLYGFLTLAGLWLVTRKHTKNNRKKPEVGYAVATRADPPSRREAALSFPAKPLMLTGPGTSSARNNELVPISDRSRSLALAGPKGQPVPNTVCPGSSKRSSYSKFAAAALLVAAYSVFAFGLPIDQFLLSYTPIPERIPLIFAVFAGTLPFFLADEWLTRGQGSARGSYSVTKFLFLISLTLAVALNFKKLFFLILIIPIILAFFIIYGLFSSWVNKRTGNPLVCGAANALAFAWAIAVTFPMLAQ